jgi:glycolate oxidase FAD binding subunit
VALPDGTLARSGGKVVKNVAGYDLPKLFTGSLGTLGMIVEATFRLHPLPETAETYTIRFGDARQANQFLLGLLSSTLTPVAVQIRSGRERPTFLDIRYEGTPAGVEAQLRSTEALAPTREPASTEVWNAREGLWMRTGDACICKLSVLPTRIGAACGDADTLAAELALDWHAVVQATGIGLLRFEGTPQRLMQAVTRLRTEVEAEGSSLVVLRRPEALFDPLDAWGSAGTALPLMRRLKQQFDPAGTLNPGRFVGGI